MYFSNKTTYKKARKLKDGDKVLLVGNIKQGQKGLSLHIKSCSLCEIISPKEPESEEEKVEIKQNVHIDEYKVVFPTVYCPTKQENIFDKKPIYDDYALITKGNDGGYVTPYLVPVNELCYLYTDVSYFANNQLPGTKKVYGGTGTGEFKGVYPVTQGGKTYIYYLYDNELIIAEADESKITPIAESDYADYAGAFNNVTGYETLGAYYASEATGKLYKEVDLRKFEVEKKTDYSESSSFDTDTEYIIEELAKYYKGEEFDKLYKYIQENGVDESVLAAAFNNPDAYNAAFQNRTKSYGRSTLYYIPDD